MVFRRFLPFLLWIFAAAGLHAQLQVDLKFSRRLYLAYEPLMASVSITNYSGRDITLENSETENWLSFQVTNSEGTLLPAHEGKARFEPRTLGAGESCRFSVNLVNIYPIAEFGAYRIRASIYFAEMDKFFSSPPRNIEVSEGKVIWQQTLGVPDGEQGSGGQRQISLLTFRSADDNDLYVRVEDREGGVIYSTQKIGRMVAQGLPQIEVDPNNKVHLLQIVGAKTYLYSCVGLNGEPIAQVTYYETKSRPKLRRLPNGNVGVAGGQAANPAAIAGAVSEQAAPKPKISDRPVQLPKDQ